MCLEFIRIYLFRFQTVSTALNSFEWFVYLCTHASHWRFTMQIINQIDVVSLNMLGTIRVRRYFDAFRQLNECDKLLIDCECSCIYGTPRGAEIHRVHTIHKNDEIFDVAFIAISVQSLGTYLLETSLYPKYSQYSKYNILFDISWYLGRSKYRFRRNFKWKSPLNKNQTFSPFWQTYRQLAKSNQFVYLSLCSHNHIDAFSVTLKPIYCIFKKKKRKKMVTFVIL